ncbi:gliding motility-associated peptidyl-prolyl isomerase GldI [Flavobacterium sp. N3904]|uniref:gliding motility-associated peptidyl-prolyl isomerase GldI n=1 Tax=Flavobacterium sp. N3904 TaxID=2986835 RepID=UPI0022254F05|nr:gliding motility-associated peptidyl-prolyl isomerase GldI [Flavobacterium sp. N3904]
MNHFKIVLCVFFATVLFSSCKQHQEARRPVSQSSGSFMKQSIARNKKLNATEKDQIDSIIKSNPSIKYIASKKGYWYSYESRNLTDSLTPKKGDIALFDYEIKDLKGNIIYSEVELQTQVYKVDKQDIMMGLRDGIKLMRKNEKVNFLFTSFMGYGFHGDNNKIGTNEPLFCTVTLHDFMPEATYNAQIQSNTVGKVNTPIKAKSIIKDTLTN